MDYQNKSKEEIIEELREVRHELDFLKASFNKDKKNQEKIEFDLNKRLQELKCHDRISEILSNSILSVDEVIEQIVLVIPPGWQFPEFAKASIQIYDKVFKTPHFEKTVHSLIQTIKVNQTIIGQIEVCYPVDQIPSQIQVFLPEESNLLFAIAVKLGNYIEKEVEKNALKLSEAKYKELIENITDVIYTTDSQANIIFISPSVKNLLGYLPEEIIGKNFVHFVGKSSEHLQKRFELIQVKSELQNEYQIMSKTGEPHWIRFSSKAIIKDNQFTGVSGTLIDVTETKRVELELQKSEALYRSILNSSPDTIFIADLNGNILFTSPMALKMFGYEKCEFLLNRSLFEFVDPKDHVKAQDAISQMFQGIFTGATEYVGIKADGSRIDMEVNGEFIRDADGNPTSMVFVARDITDRKLADRKIEKLNRLYQVISHVSQTIVHTKDKLQLMREVCRIAIEYGGFRMAWIGLIEEDTQNVKPIFVDGYDDGYLFVINQISYDDLSHDRGQTDTAISAGQYFVCNDLKTDPSVGPMRNEALKRGYHSSIALPLKQFGKVIGAFTLYSSVTNFFTDEEIRLLVEFVNEISFAFDAIETENERRSGEEQLRKLSLAVEQSPVSIVITDLDGNIEYINPAFHATTGYSYNEINGRNINILKSGETDDSVYKDLWETIRAGKEWSYEWTNKRKNGEIFWESVSITPIHNDLGKITNYLAVKQDITDRKHAEELLHESEEKFRLIFDHAFDGLNIFEEDPDLQQRRLIECNDRYAEMAGRSREELLKVGTVIQIQETISKNANLERLKSLETHTAFNGFFKWNRPDGKDNIIEYVGVPVIWHGKRYTIGVDKDVTQRVKVEEQLRKLSSAVEQSPISIVMTNRKGVIEYANPQTCKTTGYSIEELIGQNLHPLKSDETFKLENFSFWDSILQGKVWREIFHNRRKNGELYWDDAQITPVLDSDGEITSFLSISEDITDRKKAEEALLKSENELNFAQEIAQMGNWEFNQITQKYTWSKNNYLLAGMKPFEQEITPEIFLGMVYPEDVHLIIQRNQTMLENRSQESIEFRMMTPNGQIRWIQDNAVPIFEGDTMVAMKGVNIDITDKRQAEEEIKLQNDRLSAIISAIPDLMFVVNDTGTYLEYYSSKKGKLIIPDEQIIGTNIKDIFDTITATLHLQKIEECLRSKSNVIYDFSAISDKSLMTFEVRLAPLSINRVLTFVRDITDKKQKDNELQKLSLAVEQSPVSIVITDLESRIEYVNSSFLEVTGYNYEEVIGQKVNILKSGKTDDAIYKDLWETITAGKEWNGEWINKKKNGELFWESVSITSIHDENGDISNYLAVKQDITDRKKSEKEIFDLNLNLERRIEERTIQLAETNFNLLKEIDERKRVEEALSLSEKSYRTVVENVNEVIFQTNTEGFWLFLNKSWEDITGYTVNESLGQLFINYVHPDDRALNWKIFEPLIKREKEYCRHEIRYLTKEGGFRWIEVFARLGFNDKNEITGTYGTLLDITERKLAAEFENELLQLSPKLTGVTFSGINSAINMALNRIGQFLSADRTYIFEFDESENFMSNTYEWCNTGINPQIDHLQNLPCGLLPDWMEILHQHENIVITSVADLPENRKAERDFFNSLDIKSLIAIPILTENTLIGFVGLDSVVQRKDYKPSEINILKVWSSMLASLINNQRSEKLLEQTRQNYETFFNTIDDFLWVLDEQGNIIHINNTVKNRLEYSEQELYNKSVLMVHPPERRQEAGHIVVEMLAGTTEFCPVPIVTKSGKLIPVETRVKPGFWNGIPVIFGVSKDISQIQLSEQKFSSAFQSNSAMMSISNFENGDFLDVNSAVIETLGYTRDELVGRTSKELELFVDSETRDQIKKSLNQNMPVRKVEVLLRTKDGNIKTGLLSAESIFVGENRCMLIVIMDISERKEMEDNLRKARMEADQANMAKSEFLSRMSHELRTPMNSILGFGQLLQMGELNTVQKKGVSHILHSGRHLLDLINEVLDISRIEAGRLSLSMEPVQLKGIILEMTDIVRPQAINHQLEIVLDESATDLLFVKSDRQRFKQVLLNILNNAIKYNVPGGSVIIHTDLMPVNSAGIVPVRISVTDTGIGISSDDIPRIFTPFERIGAEKTTTEGTGLGLAVVKRLMDAMGGLVGVESTLGKGSTFWIELPYCESQLERVEKSGLLKDSELGKIEKRGTILYVEDNISNIELIEQILNIQRSGIQLITSVYGKEAVGLAAKYHPDLILLDLNLPDIHGSEILKLLQAEEKTKAIPVVIISADAMTLQLERLLNAGAKKYLTKPLDVMELLKVVDEFIVG